MTFRTLLTAARKGGGEAAFKSVSHSELRIELINGSAIMFKSADNPDNLRGEGLGRVVVDEAARVQRSVWEEVLRPAVSDTGGSVLFASTPKGKNIFYELYTRGQDPLQNQFRSWKFPTSDNPKVLPDDIEHARQSLPLDVFNQEYLAEFLDNSAGVFRNVGACTMPTSTPTQPEPGASYSAGLDLGRLTDFTVLTILDAKGRQVFTDRFNLLDWTIQKRRAVEAVTRYNLASLLVDATGLGDPIYEDLRNLYPNVVGYKFTNESKGRLIEALMMAFEQGEIKIFDDATQRNELDIYEYTMNRSGSVSYNAPDGYHDDTVIALALAWWQFKHNSGDWKIRWA
jgi:phage FluMu gp28-like protein